MHLGICIISSWYQNIETSKQYLAFKSYQCQNGHSQFLYVDDIMGAIASQITSLMIVYSTVHSDTDQRKHQNSTSLAFVRGFHWGPVNSPHKWPVTRKKFPFDDIIMLWPKRVTYLLNINLDASPTVSLTISQHKFMVHYFNSLMQERRNSIANALELHLSCTNPWI